MNAKLIKKTKITQDIYSLIFKSDSKFSFKPGQHLVIAFKHKGMEEVRPYSFASIPTELPFFELNIKRYKDGLGSKYMTDLKVGNKIKFEKIKGNLYLRNKNKKNIFLGTGTGIIPMISMVKSLENNKSDFYYGCRTEKDIIDFKELKSKTNSINIILSKPKTNWKGKKGYVQDNFEKLSKTSDYYICGVPNMVVQTKNKLIELGIPKKNIYTEGWEKIENEVKFVKKIGKINKFTNFIVNKILKNADTNIINK